MKEILLAGRPTFGVSAMIPSPHVVEMVGKLGYERVLIDLEHGSISHESGGRGAMAVVVGARIWNAR